MISIEIDEVETEMWNKGNKEQKWNHAANSDPRQQQKTGSDLKMLNSN